MLFTRAHHLASTSSSSFSSSSSSPNHLRATVRRCQSAHHHHRVSSSRNVFVRAAGPSASGLFDEIKKQVELTFNPRTNGAKIAGRCPDTQTIETEIDRLNAKDTLGDIKENFSEDRFALELARNITETSVKSTNWDDALKEVILESSEEDDPTMDDKECELDEFEDTAAEDVERDEYGYSVEDELPLTGRELALLCYGKYGKFHDMAVKHVKMGEGMSKWVSLNLYVGHLAQKSYPATEKEYIERCDALAYMITSWGQAGYTRRWFAEKPMARRGLPSRPRVDTCVTLQFNRSPTWDDSMGDEFFDY